MLPRARSRRPKKRKNLTEREFAQLPGSYAHYFAIITFDRTSAHGLSATMSASENQTIRLPKCGGVPKSRSAPGLCRYAVSTDWGKCLLTAKVQQSWSRYLQLILRRVRMTHWAPTLASGSSCRARSPLL